jgi:hypothetical protein
MSISTLPDLSSLFCRYESSAALLDSVRNVLGDVLANDLEEKIAIALKRQGDACPYQLPDGRHIKVIRLLGKARSLTDMTAEVEEAAAQQRIAAATPPPPSDEEIINRVGQRIKLFDDAGEREAYRVRKNGEYELLKRSDREVRKALRKERKGLSQKEARDLAEEFLDVIPKGAELKERPAPFAFADEKNVPCLRKIPFTVPENAGPLNDDGFPVATPAWNEFLIRTTYPEGAAAIYWAPFEKQDKGRQVAWFRGDGQDGKSCALKVIHELLGRAAKKIPEDTSKNNKFVAQSMAGVRLAYHPDNKNRHLIQSAFIHAVTGGDALEIEGKGKTTFDVNQRMRVIVNANPSPILSTQVADQSRVLIIEVKAAPESQRTAAWENQLRAELPMFLAYARQKYRELCPDFLTIRPNAAAKKHLEAATAHATEEFSTVFERKFRLHEKASLSGTEFVGCLEGLRWSSGQIADFKQYLRSTYKDRVEITMVDGKVCYRGLTTPDGLRRLETSDATKLQQKLAYHQEQIKELDARLKQLKAENSNVLSMDAAKALEPPHGLEDVIIGEAGGDK